MTLTVAPCSYEAAKYAVLRWHYSRVMPQHKTFKLGVWEHGQFIGAVLFGDGANKGIVTPYGLDYTEGCELTRIALRHHAAPVTRIASIALRLVKEANPALRLVVSYADPEYGHLGGIYQAGNWIYVGCTTPADEYIVNGRRMHGRALRSIRHNDGRWHRQGHVPAANILEWTRKVLDPNARIVPGSMKYRYLYPLDRAMRRKIAPLAQPYPRGGSVDSDTSGLRPERAGATPAHRSTILTRGA